MTRLLSTIAVAILLVSSAVAILPQALAVQVNIEDTNPGPLDPLDGTLADCDYSLGFLEEIFTDVGISPSEAPAWVWVDPSQKLKSVTGLVTRAEVTYTDFPTVHDSHDFNIDVLVDPGFENLVSTANDDDPSDPRSPDTIEAEWEIGTFTDEDGSGAPERTFPRWAWPSKGDRVWMDGNWVFDCGHPDDLGRYRSEIHPPRAVASMRQQARTLPGTGTTPVPVTATDLYIHGRAGFVGDVLECGQGIIKDEGSCGVSSYPHRGTSIEYNFTFEIPLPPKPFQNAVLGVLEEETDDNTIHIPVQFPDNIPPDATSVQVTIPLEGTGVTPDDVYGRHIYLGWIFPPDPPLRHLQLTLNKIDLHEDHDIDPADCECTFFWLNLDRSTSEWFRLVDFEIPTDDEAGFGCFSHTNTLSDYDDDDGCGNGELNFSGPTFDFYVGNDQPFTLTANGYDQDCLDDWMGDHDYSRLMWVDCYLADIDDPGENDPLSTFRRAFVPPDYGVGSNDISAGDYDLEFTISEIPVTTEDMADLVLTKVCKPDQPALAGENFTCTVIVENPGGPGLPRNVLVDDILLTDVAHENYTVSGSFTFGGNLDVTAPCDDPEDIPGGSEIRCDIGTVPLGGKAIISITVNSESPGDFNNMASVRTDSEDPDLNNNRGLDNVTVVLCIRAPVCRADLAIEKSAFPKTVETGRTLKYELKVVNNGPSVAVGVVVEDVLPSQVDFVSVTVSNGVATCVVLSVSGPPATKKVSCQLGILQPNADSPAFIYIEVLVRATRGTFTNVAMVSSSTNDPDLTNNSDSTSISLSSTTSSLLSATLSLANPIGLVLVSVAGLLVYSAARTRRHRSLRTVGTTSGPSKGT